MYAGTDGRRLHEVSRCPLYSKCRFARHHRPASARLLTRSIRNPALGQALDLLQFNLKRGASWWPRCSAAPIATADTQEADVEKRFSFRNPLRRGTIIEALHAQRSRQEFPIFQAMLPQSPREWTRALRRKKKGKKCPKVRQKPRPKRRLPEHN